MLEIRTPLLDSDQDGEEFLFISGQGTCTRTQSLTDKVQRMAVLQEDCANTRITCVSLQLKWLGKVRQREHWSRDQGILEGLKSS
jgi:hypothetical protein